MTHTISVHDRYADAEIRSFYDAGFWRPEGLSALLDDQADARGGKVFVSDGSGELTYADLRDRRSPSPAASRASASVGVTGSRCSCRTGPSSSSSPRR
jgi:non-ribosomal peptide synthetase component E (peptide arylation enzyme)